MSRYSENIKNYYDSSQWLYSLFVYNQKSLGMHFGFWYPDTKNRQQSIINENQEIIEIGKIKKGQKILDAGCGVGGTAIYIAKVTGAKVWGVTLSKNQAKLANKYAKKYKASKLTEFSSQDYHVTDFPNNYFDLVYGVESICYSHPKTKFLIEALRILKPGGKLIILDGYISKKPDNEIELNKLDEFNTAFSIKEIISEKEYASLINKAGFINLKSIDKTDKVLPSAKYFYLQGKRFYLLIKLLSLVPSAYFKAFEKNRVATNLFYEFLLDGFGSYFIHYAEKPKR